MKIGILGSGNMGRSLGILWSEHGHDVFFGARTAAAGQAVADLAGGTAQGGTNDEAAVFGEVLLYTIRGIDPVEVLASIDVLADKILIDCNNQEIPPDFAYPPIARSIAETLAEQVPQARVVKAFNTMAQEVFELSPTPLKEYEVSCFVSSDDAEARTIVMQLASEIGFAPIDCGKLQNARLLEGLADFIRLMIGGQGMGAYATVSVHVLPPAQQERLGGRRASHLH